jgi:hypothetical protein
MPRDTQVTDSLCVACMECHIYIQEVSKFRSQSCGLGYEQIHAERCQSAVVLRNHVELTTKCRATIDSPQRIGNGLETVNAILWVQCRFEPRYGLGSGILRIGRFLMATWCCPNRENCRWMDDIVYGLLAKLHSLESRRYPVGDSLSKSPLPSSCCTPRDLFIQRTRTIVPS